MQSNGSVERLLDFIRQSKVRDVQSFVRQYRNVRQNRNLSADDIARIRRTAEDTERSWRSLLMNEHWSSIAYGSLMYSVYFGFLGAMYTLVEDIDPGAVLDITKMYTKDVTKRISPISVVLSYVRHYSLRTFNTVRNGFKYGCLGVAGVALLTGVFCRGYGVLRDTYLNYGKRKAANVRSVINDAFSESHV